ncbi:TetR/AcrR family transcriptional regulator [Gallaecimonas mangrovi]|uniref:TetR/AcrR family transcriptional regulator n=1 Tax=Gallaecimonas mangrovi TaxID=2291597 RepID=UPI000E208591|nr:TetR/AcrR family transcriptional regulator [Gallaecimonas mangrovi]
MTAQPKARPPRADALRNRQAIVEAARQLFESEGVLVALDRIAATAGVGNATLYRNFATRDELLVAVFDAEIEGALAMGDRLAQSLTPAAALQEWLVQLSWQLRIWHDLPHCVASASRDPDSALVSPTQRLIDKTAQLLAAAADTVKGELDGEALFEMMTILSWGIDRYGDSEAAARQRVLQMSRGLFH